ARLDTRDAPHPAQPPQPRDSGIAEGGRQAGLRRPATPSWLRLPPRASSWPPAPTGQSGSSRESDSTSGLGGLTSVDRDQPARTLLAQKIPLKDFSSEIRANMDIQRFLKEATLLLDVEGGQPGSGGGGGDGGSVAGAAGAIDSRLDAKVQDAKKTLFLQANWMDYTYQRLAKTIKSISVVDSEGLITDNSWLCTIKGTQERPSKLGRRSPPSWADSEFRQKLLLAETEATHDELGEEQKIYRRKSLRTKDFMSQAFNYESSWPICNGIRAT
uniref:VPS13 domain-containing protein n=1 Tax=Macrostomum lignano TaxID=282301 RepID=A0A1I8FK66_9PLAT